MLDAFKRYVDQGYMKFGKDEIRFGKERMVFYYVTFTESELALNARLGGWKYLATKFIASRKEGEVLLKQHGGPNMEEMMSPLNASLKVMNLLGMGRDFKVIENDSPKGFAVVTGISELAKVTASEKKSKRPIDFVIGGILTGTVAQYGSGEAYAAELSCVAQGDPECRWAIGGAKEILGYVSRSEPSKVSLAEETINSIQEVERLIKGNGRLKALVEGDR